jgi:hypothetical protein
VEKGHNPFFCEKNAKAKKKEIKKMTRAVDVYGCGSYK